jgi:hypothetical protein
MVDTMSRSFLALLFTSVAACGTYSEAPTQSVDIGTTESSAHRSHGTPGEVTSDKLPVVAPNIRKTLPVYWSVPCGENADGIPFTYLADEIRNAVSTAFGKWPGLYQEAPCGTYSEGGKGPSGGVAFYQRNAPGSGATYYLGYDDKGVWSHVELRGDWFFAYSESMRARIVIHEMMHLVGLDHIDLPGCLMNSVIGGKDTPLSLCGEESWILDAFYAGR